jgi:uncharacterized protein (TIGR02284 family)
MPDRSAPSDPLRTRPIEPSPIVERQAAGPGQTTPVRFKEPPWPAPGPGPWPLVPPPDVVPPPLPAPHAIASDAPYPIEPTHEERIDDDALAQLDELVALNEDSSRRLEHEAESVDDMRVAALLRAVALERGMHARQLEPHVLAHGIEPSRTRNGRRLHRLWLRLRRLVRRPDTERVLRACEHEEREVEAAYDAALAVLPRGRVRDLVVRQRDAVVAAHHRVEEMLA